MGHKSLETTMRYLAPASDVHARLERVQIPGLDQQPLNDAQERRQKQEQLSTAPRRRLSA